MISPNVGTLGHSDYNPDFKSSQVDDGKNQPSEAMTEQNHC